MTQTKETKKKSKKALAGVGALNLGQKSAVKHAQNKGARPHGEEPLEDRVDIVDEHDNVIGQATRVEAREKKLRFRVVHIILINEDGQMLVQWRHRNKGYAPRTFTASADGAVDAGETYEQAAQRELAEEMGVTNLALKEVGAFALDDGEGVPVNGMLFVGDYSGTVSGWEAEAEEIDAWDFDEAYMMLERFPYLLAGSFQVSLALLFNYLEEKNDGKNDDRA